MVHSVPHHLPSSSSPQRVKENHRLAASLQYCCCQLLFEPPSKRGNLDEQTGCQSGYPWPPGLPSIRPSDSTPKEASLHQNSAESHASTHSRNTIVSVPRTDHHATSTAEMNRHTISSDRSTTPMRDRCASGVYSNDVISVLQTPNHHCPSLAKQPPNQPNSYSWSLLNLIGQPKTLVPNQFINQNH